VDSVFATLEKSATDCAYLTVMRHGREGLVDDEARRRFALVVAHVRRALVIGKVIDLHKVEAAALADSLDTLASGMFIVDGMGRIAHANASGHMMLAERDVLCAPGGRLGAVDAPAAHALLETFAAAGSGDMALGRRGIAVPLKAHDGERYLAHVLPLTSGRRRTAGVSYAAVAVIFVHKAALDLPSPLEAIAQHFRLTPMELRVLFTIVEMGSVPEVADVLGISEATVKTHLHHVFQKTKTGRQSELVKLVAGYSNPLLG
jgi:DNA-binding CsgD family transcriptional regulator